MAKQNRPTASELCNWADDLSIEQLTINEWQFITSQTHHHHLKQHLYRLGSANVSHYLVSTFQRKGRTCSVSLKSFVAFQHHHFQVHSINLMIISKLINFI